MIRALMRVLSGRRCDGFLKPLILQCLDRDQAKRPSFTDIILKLRQLR